MNWLELFLGYVSEVNCESVAPKGMKKSAQGFTLGSDHSTMGPELGARRERPNKVEV